MSPYVGVRAWILPVCTWRHKLFVICVLCMLECVEFWSYGGCQPWAPLWREQESLWRLSHGQVMRMYIQWITGIVSKLRHILISWRNFKRTIQYFPFLPRIYHILKCNFSHWSILYGDINSFWIKFERNTYRPYWKS